MERNDIEHEVKSLHRRISATTVCLFSINPITFDVTLEASAGKLQSLHQYQQKLRYSPIRDIAFDREEIFETQIVSSIYPKHRWLLYAFRYQSFIGCPVNVSSELSFCITAFHEKEAQFENYDIYEVKLAAERIAHHITIHRFANSHMPDQIIRSIEFPPEYYHSGLSILTYFNPILHSKYPDTQAKIRIEQDGLIIRMIIETPSGEREEIEKTLYQYGLVLKGTMLPDQFLSDPMEVLGLKNRLEISALELRLTKELMEHTSDLRDKRIQSLESELDRLLMRA